jgi:drug/metabolite transporter (DMT)-like permease
VNWVNIAILSAAVIGVVNIIDSHLLSRRMPSLGSFLLPVGIITLIYASVLFALFPLPDGTSTLTLFVALTSGILRSVAITIMLYTLRREEVSLVIPVVHTYPVFVAIMAIPILGESLVSLQWLAVIIVVAGAVMASIRRGITGKSIWLGKSFLLLLGSSLLMAAADITSKYALAHISPWNLYWLTAFCMSFLFFSLSLRPSVFKELRWMQHQGLALSLLTLNELLALVGAVLSFWAIERGPVSLVSTIIGTRSLFVFIYTLILSRVSPTFLEWNWTRAILVLRFTAIAMIIAGVAIIHLV